MSVPNPSDSLNWIDQAKNYLQQSQYVEALNCIHQGLVVAPRNADAWLQCGSILQKMGFYQDAITANNNAQRLLGSPNSQLQLVPLEAILGKAVAQPETDRPPSAAISMPAASAVSASPSMANEANGTNGANGYEFWQDRARAFTQAKDYASALVAYDRAIEINPDRAQDWYQRGLVLFYARRLEDAIASFDQALEHQPDLYQAWNNRASIHIQLGNMEEAIHSYEQALRWTDKQLWQAWEDMGMAVYHAQGADAAVATWEEGIQALWCDSDDYDLGCGSLHQRKGDIQAQAAWQQTTPQPLWKAAKLSYLKALELLNFQTFPHQHLSIWQSLLQIRLYLQETASAHSMLLEGAIKLQTLKKEKNLSSAQDLRLEDEFSGFQQMQVDWLIQQKSLPEAILWAEQSKNRHLGRWRFGADYIPTPLEYADFQPLLNPQRAIIYWHISPTHLNTFVLKSQAAPIAYGASTEDTDELATQERPQRPPTEQRFQLKLWQRNWDRNQRQFWQKQKTDNSLGPGASWWLEGQAIQLLGQLKGLLAIDALCEDTLSGIQELILVIPPQWRSLPIAALFPEDFVITLLPSLQLGINLLKANPRHQDHLLSIVPPGSSKTQENSTLPELEAQAIAASYRRNMHLGGPQLTHKTVTAALKMSGGSVHFTGVTGLERQAKPTPAWQLTDEHRLTVDDLLQMDWHAYPLVCLSGGTRDAQPLPNFVPDVETSLLTAGVQHVLKSLWQVNHCSRILLMAHFHHLLHQNCNPVHALKHAQHWLRNLTYQDMIQWWDALAAKETLDPKQTTVLEQIKSSLTEAAQEAEPRYCPLSHPWHWAGYTIAGNFPEMVVWQTDLS